MNIKQNLEIIKNISTIDIEFNRRLASIGYQLFSNDREIDESVYNEQMEKFKESLLNIKKSVALVLINVENLSTKIETGENNDK